MNTQRRTLVAILVALVAVMVLLQASAKRHKKVNHDEDADQADAEQFDTEASSRDKNTKRDRPNRRDEQKVKPTKWWTTTEAPDNWDGSPTLPPKQLWTSHMWNCFRDTLDIQKCVKAEKERQKRLKWPKMDEMLDNWGRVTWTTTTEAP